MENPTQTGNEEQAPQLSVYEQLRLKRQEREAENHFDFFDYYGKPVAKAAIDGSTYIFEDGRWKPFDFLLDEERESQKLGREELQDRFPEAFSRFDEDLGSKELFEQKKMKKRLRLLLYPDTLQERFNEAIQRFEEEERLTVLKALDFAKQKHEGQYRQENTPYITHCIDVALYAIENGENAYTAIVLLLHDVLEDTDTTYDEIETAFGKEIADDVQSLSKVRNGQKVPLDQYHAEIENSPKLSRYKGYDRLSNALTLYYSPDGEWRTDYIQKTRTQVIPLVQKSSPSLADQIEKALQFVENNPTPTEQELERIEELRLIRAEKEKL